MFKNNMYEKMWADSFLEYFFLRWVLSPATKFEIRDRIVPQHMEEVGSTRYRIDYAVAGRQYLFAIELDGAQYHTNEQKDRIRQKRLERWGWKFLRFSYEEVIYDMEGCICRIHQVFGKDSLLKTLLVTVNDSDLEAPDLEYAQQEWYETDCGVQRNRREMLESLIQAKRRAASSFSPYKWARYLRESAGTHGLDELQRQAYIAAKTQLWELTEYLEGHRDGEF